MSPNAPKYQRYAIGLCASVLLAQGFSTAAKAQPNEACEATAQQVAQTYDYILGAQAFAAPGHGHKSNRLVEQARGIRKLGSNVLKISLGRRQANEFGFGDAARGARSELQYVKAAPELQQTLDMDFKYYQFWVQTFTGSNWNDGVSDSEAKLYYDEMYELTAWLLTRYSGTGKVFLLGNWEGDWLLGGRGNHSAPSQKAIDGMIRWLNIRQKAIDDAKAATSHHDVEVYHYVEVNLVKRALEGKASVASSVIPATNVDLVSYSSYEAIKQPEGPDVRAIRAPLTKVVNYLEGQLKPKTGLPFDRRVFIGEYGFHANKDKPLTVREQFQKSRNVMQVAIELNLPFALIWQLYNNEYAPDGTSQEMSLIDDAGHKRALYYLHQQFLSQMSAFVIDSCQQSGKAPTRQAFKAKALDVLAKLSYEKMQKLADGSQAVH